VIQFETSAKLFFKIPSFLLQFFPYDTKHVSIGYDGKKI
jgi:hypothetical protein